MKKTAFFLLLLGMVTLLTAQQCTTGQKNHTSSENGISNLPDTPAGKAAKKLIGVITGGDQAEAGAYIKNEMTDDFRDQFPMSMHMDLFKMMKTEYGDMQVVGLRMNGPHDLTIMGKSKESGKMMKINLEVEDNEPHRVASLGIEPDASFGSQATQQEVSLNKLEDLETYLRKLTDDGEFSGAVLLAKDGKVLFEGAYGLADKTKKITNRVDTKFNLGSLNKFFTATAVMQLVEKGKIDLDATLNVYTNIFSKKVGSKVTVRHLLQHRGGWSHYWDNVYFNEHLQSLKSIDDYMVFIKDIPLGFEPGTQQQYSNTGYEVLGHIIEKTSGMSYDDFVRQYIYDKAGMSNTGAFERDKPIPNAAIGYTAEGGEVDLIPNTDILPVKGTAAGGGYSTVHDFLKFENALFNGQLLKAESLALMFNNYEPGELPQSGALSLAGGAQGVSTNWVKNFASPYSAFVFSNYDMGTARPVANAIMKMTEALNDVSKTVSFYRVTAACGAVPEIGCGIATKPVLLELQQQKGVKAASLNRPGTAIAVSWNEPTAKADRDAVVFPVFNEFEMKIDEALGENYKNLLASFKGDDLWYKGREVDKLSMEEAAEIGKKVTAKIREFRDISDEDAAGMEADIRAFFQKVLTKDYGKKEFEEGDVATDWTPNVESIVEKYVGKGNFPEEVKFKFGVSPASKKAKDQSCSQPGKSGCEKSCCKPGGKTKS